MQTSQFTLLRLLRLIAYSTGGLSAFYLLIYLSLSLCGQYRPMPYGDPRHIDLYPTWAPLGFYDPYHSPPGSLAEERGLIIGTWRAVPVRIFYPLWIFDIQHIHKTKQPNTALEPTPTAPSAFAPIFVALRRG
jgi:hypothetical protein